MTLELLHIARNSEETATCRRWASALTAVLVSTTSLDKAVPGLRSAHPRPTIRGMSDTKQPPSRAMADRDRYRPPVQDERVEVCVDGVDYSGEVLGRNGARVHVVFVKDGARYRRWVDAAAVSATQP